MKAKVKRMFEVVGSNMIHKIGFDPTTPGVEAGYLVVQFANLDAWGYSNVAYFDALQVMNAESIGTAFNTLIKGKYKGEPLNAVKDTHIVNPGAVSKPKPKEGDELPMLDVVGVDSSAGVGKVSSVQTKQRGRK